MSTLSLLVKRRINSRRILYLISAVLLLAISSTWALDRGVSATSISDFRAGNIIDNSIFTNSSALSVQDIQSFLNSKVPVCDTNGTQLTTHSNGSGGYYTRAQWGAIYDTNNNTTIAAAPYVCLKDYVENTTTHQNNLQGASVTGGVSAAQIIYDAAQAYSINPEVLIVTLQKEQGLVTDDWPWANEYTEAMGYNCPDTPNGAACSGYQGFYNQVDNAAWQFRDYLNNPQKYNYTAGTFYVPYNTAASGCQYGATMNLNAASAALYNYTPYTPDSNVLGSTNSVGSPSGPGGTINDICAAYGNRNFWWYFNSWFGSSVGCGGSLSDISYQVDVWRAKKGFNPYFVINSGTSEGCVEVHGWNGNFTSWVSHIATNQASIDSHNSRIEVADINGDGIPEFILVGLAHTGSGMVEFHVWDQTLQKWTAHIASNQPAVDPANSTVEFADINGDGKAEAILVGLRNTGSGMVEFHVWNPGFQSWMSHTASNQPAVDPANSAVDFGDVNGDNVDRAILVGLRNTGSGMVEFHVWNPGFQSWMSHTASNQPAVDPANSAVDFGDVNGDGRDEAILEGLHATSSGKLEFHFWNPGFQSWMSHTASNQDVLK